MSTAAVRGVSFIVVIVAIMIAWRLLSVNELVQEFKQKPLKDKYDYVIGTWSSRVLIAPPFCYS